jgi:hypothetical protein
MDDRTQLDMDSSSLPGDAAPTTIAHAAAVRPAVTPLPGITLLTAVLAVDNDQPVVLVTHPAPAPARSVAELPIGQFVPLRHSSLDAAARDSVVTVANVEIGHAEQLSTEWSGPKGDECLTIGYLALGRVEAHVPADGTAWVSCYSHLPWEDLRHGRAAILTEVILPKLQAWAAAEPAAPTDETADPLSRAERLRIAFGLDGGRWDDERVVERLDIICAAEALVEPDDVVPLSPSHLRLVATALARLRAKVRNRPVIFEMLPPEFTLFELQRAVEGILGPNLHKQNFRRLVEGTGLVEATGEVRTHTGGRPAKLFRFRREVLLERSTPGVTIKRGCAA